MIRGHTAPRVCTAPLRPLTPDTSAGFAFADWCGRLGAPLLEWQRETAVRLLELREDGQLRYRTALIMVGRQNGKSIMAAMLALWWLYERGARLVVGAAQTRDVAAEVWQRAADTVDAAPASAGLEVPRQFLSNGKERLEWRDGRRYVVKAANRRARGLSPQLVLVDELREQQDYEGWQALSSMILAQREGMVLALSSAGDDSSVVLNELLERARRDAAAPGYAGDLFLAEYSSPDGSDVDDPAAWAYAMPALGDTVTLEAIEGLRSTLPAARFRTEVMCIRATSTRDSALDRAAWDACADPAGTLTSSRGRLAAAVDVSRDGQHVSLAVAACQRDGSVRVELAGAWGSVADARAELPDLLARIGPRVVGWLSASPATALAADVRRVVADRAVEVSKAAEACMAFESLVAGRRLAHGGQQLLDEHVGAASRMQKGEGWIFSRREPGAVVDALYAAAVAVHLARTMPAPTGQSRLITAA